MPMRSDETLGTADPGLLYRTHFSWLQGWLVRRIGCRDNAADLAQDTFVRVLKHRHQSGALREPRAYLSSIARGLMIDQYRRRELERAYLESITLLPQHEVPSEESRLMILDALERIDRLLDSLKPRVRQAFLFARLDGLTCAQIAEKLGVSRATVERDLATALQHCYRLRYVEA
jgi:RNA polymerase sigma factor (sigma-70 family)